MYKIKTIKINEKYLYVGRKRKKKMIKFVLDGCDISFVAEAPQDITLKQLLEQCDKIKPMWCACGISSLEKKGYSEDVQTEIMEL